MTAARIALLAADEYSGVVAAPVARVRVESDLGSVRVEAGRDDRVRYRIRVRASSTGEDAARRLEGLVVSASRSGDLLLFRGMAASPDALEGLSADFDITIPRATPRLEIWTGAGDLTVGGIDAIASLTSEAGRISVGDLAGPLEARTRGGDIEVARVRAAVRLATSGGSVRVEEAGGDVEARTSGGDVQIGRVAGRVRAETGAGFVRIESSGGDAVVVTSGGDIDLGRIEGHVSAATAGGGIRVASARGGAKCETAAGSIVLHAVDGPLRAVTSAGSIRAAIRGGGLAFSESDLQALRGDVVVSIPESIALTVRALVENSPGRGIRSDFPLNIVREAESAGRPLERAEGDIGGGGSILRIRALGGDIVILRDTGPGRAER